MAPQAIQFCGEVERRSVRILLRRSVPLRIAHDAVAVNVKPVVVAVKGQVASVQGIKRRARVSEGQRVKTPHAVPHVRLVSIGHAVAVRIGHTGVEVDAVAVFIQLSGETSREAWCRAVCGIGPAELLSGVEPVPVSVDGGVGSVVFVQTLNDDVPAVHGRPVHPFFEQGFVDVGDQIPVGVGVGWRCPVRVVGVDV